MADVHIWGTMAHTSTIPARRPSTHKRRDGRQPERDGSYTLGVGGTCTRRRRRRQRDRTWRRRHLLPFFLLLLPFPFFFSFFFLPPPSSTYLLLLCSLTSARGRAPHGQTDGQGPGGLPRGRGGGAPAGRAPTRRDRGAPVGPRRRLGLRGRTDGACGAAGARGAGAAGARRRGRDAVSGCGSAPAGPAGARGAVGAAGAHGEGCGDAVALGRRALWGRAASGSGRGSWRRRGSARAGRAGRFGVGWPVRFR